MSDHSPRPPVSVYEISNTRHNLDLLLAQARAGTLDTTFLTQQIEKLTTLLDQLEAQQRDQRRGARFEALYNVSRLLGSSLDLQIVLDQVMDAILQLTGAERGFIMLRDDDGQINVTTARNLDQQTLSSDQSHYSRTIVEQVMDAGQPLVTTNAAEDPRFATQASIVGQALRSIMATPLRARGRVIGVVYVDNRIHANLFDDDDLAALDAFAGQAAVAIDNARLFAATDQQLQARIEELTELRRIDMRLNETLDADKAMLITLYWACRTSGASTGYLGLVEGEPPGVRTAQSYGVDPDETFLLQLHTAYPEVLEVAASGETRQLTTKHPDYTHTLITPVHRNQQVIAVVVLNRTGEFSAEQQEMVGRIVARAAVAIENARLYAAVQAANNAKSDFVGIVAHDLKVPMTSIMGYADLTLLAGGLSERQVSFQENIRETVQRMEVLVSDLADISRIESGRFYMTPSDVAIQELVQALRDSMLTQLDARRHTLVEDIGPALPGLHVDYYRLLQVLTNLISNAIKYTPAGGTITLRIRENGNTLEFSVADTGVGLTPDEQRMLGTKFWRADNDFIRAQPGSGLGIAITRGLIEQMGGKLQIESEVGRGSTFTFNIPIHHA